MGILTLNACTIILQLLPLEPNRDSPIHPLPLLFQGPGDPPPQLDTTRRISRHALARAQRSRPVRILQLGRADDEHVGEEGLDRLGRLVAGQDVGGRWVRFGREAQCGARAQGLRAAFVIDGLLQ